MSWFRKYPFFAFGLTVCALLALAELGLTYERWAASREAVKNLAQRKSDLGAMATLTPAPTREIAKAIEADLAKAQASLASMQTELKGRGPAAERLRAAKVPAARTDAFFDLATFVERTRELAKKNEVEVRPEAARFGFAAYANVGPDEKHIDPVFRQRLVAQFLVESLVEAKPRALLAVKRERTVTKDERDARNAALQRGEPPPEPPPDAVIEDSPDYFVVDPRVTARVGGYIDTTGFQFVFVGQTAALRNFLNKLAAFELPVLVREVEVDIPTGEELAVAPPADDGAPAAGEGSAPAAPSVVLAPGAPAVPAAKTAASARSARPVTPPTPIVSKPYAKFTVTVEFVELVAPAAPAADPSAPPPPTP